MASSNKSEVMKAARLKCPDTRAFGHENLSGGVCHVADVGRGHTAERAWQPFEVARADGEEQLEIFATVQGEQERVERAPPAEAFDIRINRDARGVNERSRAALTTEMCKVGREAIADVYHGRRQM